MAGVRCDGVVMTMPFARLRAAVAPGVGVVLAPADASEEASSQGRLSSGCAMGAPGESQLGQT
jgi:hypothetical protein